MKFYVIHSTEIKCLGLIMATILLSLSRPVALAGGDPGQPAPSDRCIKGEKGDKGWRGFYGRPGLAGADGMPGSQGIKGCAGEKGESGLPGRKGQKGRGIRGDRGEVGSTGAPGIPGELQVKGGPPGPIGDPGPQGDPGSRGSPGSKGSKGERGIVQCADKGKKGFKGKGGKNGECGDEGISPDCATFGINHVVYTLWGDDNCPNGVTVLFDGVTKINSEEKPICLSNSGIEGKERFFKEATNIVQLKNVVLDFNGEESNPVICALCLLNGKSNTITVSKKVGCPDGYKKEYDGYFPPPETQSICVAVENLKVCVEELKDTEVPNGDDCDSTSEMDTMMDLVRWTIECTDCETNCTVCSGP